MKTIALIRLPSVTFGAEEVPDAGMYLGPGVNAFTDQVSEGLRGALSQSNLKCGAVGRTFKPGGSGFNTGETGNEYLITVCAEPNGSPGANLIIQVTPRRKRGASWPSFEPQLRAAVEAQFPGSECHWMTIDEFIDSEQSV